MGGENTKYAQHKPHSKVEVNNALRKQREMYERKCQELLNAQKPDENKKKQETIDKAIEALENEKKLYQKKYEELMQKQQQPPNHQSSNINCNTDPSVNVYESIQNTIAIYPKLPNYYATQSTSMMQPPFMSGPCTSHSSMVPSAPPVFDPATAHCQPALISPQVTNVAASNYGSGPRREVNNNQFNCQSCNNKFQNQVFKCQNKHNSCRNCKTKQVPCGVCGQSIVDYRNFALEKRLVGLQLENSTNQEKCPNSIDGCCLYFKPQDMKKHLKECPFNDILCPLVYTQRFSCFWKGKINQLRYHFQENHPEQCVGDVDKELSLDNINEDSYTAFFVTLGAFNFMVHIKVERAEIMMTAQLIGTKVSAEKWTYQFHVYNKKAPRRKFQYNAVCHSNAYLAHKIFSEANCAVLYPIHAKSFANNGQLTYKFYLMKERKNVKVGNKTN